MSALYTVLIASATVWYVPVLLINSVSDAFSPCAIPFTILPISCFKPSPDCKSEIFKLSNCTLYKIFSLVIGMSFSSRFRAVDSVAPLASRPARPITAAACGINCCHSSSVTVTFAFCCPWLPCDCIYSALYTLSIVGASRFFTR